MTKPLSAFVEEFDELVLDSENMLFITRDSDLQRSACSKLQAALESILIEKQTAIESCNEDYANLLLGCEFVAHALLGELNMWVQLKEEKPDLAWRHLVDAQMASTDAARAHVSFQHLESYHQRLVAIQHLIFPPQLFMSSGMLVRVQECSICGQDYDECNHLIGRPYMGKLCCVSARDIILDHVAIVKDPADKRCRVVTFSVEGGMRNKMTWKIESNT